MTDVPEVAVKGLSIGGAFNAGTFMLAVVAFIKVWPILQLNIIKAKAALRGERRDEIKTLRDDLDLAIDTINKTRMELVDVKSALMASNIRINQYDFALRLASNEIERRIPDSSVPAQIRELLAAAVPKTAPSNIAQSDMDIIRKGNA